MRIFSRKRGIIGEQLFMIFSLIVVIVFTVVAVRYTNGLAKGLVLKQDYYVKDVSFLIATGMGAPGILVYDYYISEEAKFDIGPVFSTVALKDTESKHDVLKYLFPSKFYHLNKRNFDFKPAENITQVQLLNYDQEFAATLPSYYTIQELDCMQYLRHDTRADFSGKKIVIDPGRGGGDTGANENDDKDKNLQEGTSLFITLGGQLAAGASILMTRDKDISVSQDKRDSIAGDIFISIHGMGGKKEEEIVIGKPTRENKKFACLLSRETGIKTIKQQDDKYIRNNPSSIAVSLYIGPGKFANSIANAVRSYYV